jgi:hypothetical protein
VGFWKLIDRLKTVCAIQIEHQRKSQLPTDRVICPLCWDLNIGVTLSDEHVFPSCIEGRIRMITCSSCNNTSGAKCDSHLGLELEQHRAMTGGTVGPPVKSVIRMEDIRLTANMRCSADGNFDLTIVGNKRATNPEHLKRSLQYMKDGEVAKFKISLPIPHPEKVSQATLKSCYLAASMFIGYEWARASAPDFVRKVSMGEVDSTHLESFVYRFPSFGVDLGGGFMIGILSGFDLMLLTFPVGSEPAYFRGAVLPFADQSITQFCQNAQLFLSSLAIGSNTIAYRECYVFDSEYQIMEMHNEST